MELSLKLLACCILFASISSGADSQMRSESAGRQPCDCFFKANSVCIQTTLRYNSICIGNTGALLIICNSYPHTLTVSFCKRLGNGQMKWLYQLRAVIKIVYICNGVVSIECKCRCKFLLWMLYEPRRAPSPGWGVCFPIWAFMQHVWRFTLETWGKSEVSNKLPTRKTCKSILNAKRKLKQEACQLYMEHVVFFLFCFLTRATVLGKEHMKSLNFRLN